MVQWQAHDFQGPQIAIGHVAVQLPLPFFIVVGVRNAEIKTAIIDVIELPQAGVML